MNTTDIDVTELLDGEEIMGPSPFTGHQRIVRNIYDAVGQYIKSKELGELFFSPLDVILEEGMNRLQPDLVFVRRANQGIIQDWIRGVPDMVCEVVSPGTFGRDTETKRDIYERYEVPEYWIVIPELKTVEVLAIEQGRYRLYSIAEGEGGVASKIIEGLNVDISAIFLN